MKFYFKGGKFRFKNKTLIGGHTEKSDGNNKFFLKFQLLGEIREIMINYFTRKKVKKWTNRNFQNDPWNF